MRGTVCSRFFFHESQDRQILRSVDGLSGGSGIVGPQWYDKSILILGCGNVLIGDDGFGPAVAQKLCENFPVPPDVCVLDAGTSVREILFDTILSDKKPVRIVVVDAMDCGRKPGELFWLELDALPQVKLDDFSMHQIPTSNLLRELRDLCATEVVVMACQVSGSADRVSPGLSIPVQRAVEKAAEVLARKYLG
jgi:coenzyme F420 hydrogenase subunit delta